MKKLKLFGAAVIAASLILSGCANGADDEITPEPTKPAVENPTDPIGGTDNNNDDGENNGGEDNNGGSESGSGEEAGSGDSGDNNDTGDGEDTGDNEGSGDDNDTTTNPKTDGYTVTFSDSSNSSSFADGVYTITLGTAHAASDEWGNQIFIKGLNEAAGIANGDKIKTTATVKADKAITTFFFKNQFHEGDSYPGIDTSASLEAETEKVVDIYGTVREYNETTSLVIAIRGNEADTTLTLKDVKVDKLSDYAITSVKLDADSDTIAAGETATLKAVDQYGFEITDATFEITSENPTATISGNVLTTGDTAEEITVVAKKGEITSNPLTITITAEKDYAKYWTPEQANIGRDAAPKDYFSIWADQWWCGSGVALSNMSATEDGISLTQTVEGFNWFGTQIWYGLSTISNISFKVTSTVAGDITINTGKGNVVYTLEAGVEKEFSFEAAKDLLAIQLGKESEPASILGDCTFTISDFSVTAAE